MGGPGSSVQEQVLNEFCLCFVRSADRSVATMALVIDFCLPALIIVKVAPSPAPDATKRAAKLACKRALGVMAALGSEGMLDNLGPATGASLEVLQ